MIAENNPNCGKEMDILVKEASLEHQADKTRKEPSPHNFTLKTLAIQSKERLLEAARENCQVTYQSYSRCLNRNSKCQEGME
jgi:hypothetical protein